MLTRSDKMKHRILLTPYQTGRLRDVAKAYEDVLAAPTLSKAIDARSRAMEMLFRLAAMVAPREGEDDVLYGHNHPRLSPLFDDSYKHTGTFAGQTEPALIHCRKCLKRGYL